jgi:hypothetical protein
MQRTLISLGLLFSAFAPFPSHAAILRVDSGAPGSAQDGATWQTAYRTIQGALNAAQRGDEVWVRNTTFFEDLTVATPDLTLIGGFAGTEQTNVPEGAAPATVTGTGAPRVVLAISASASGITVRGFRIVDGARGGIRVDAAGATIASCAVNSNGSAGGEGGGIFCSPGSEVTIRDSTIAENTSRYGAGIRATDAIVTISNSVISRNEAAHVHLAQPGDALAEGGGIYLDGGTAWIKNNEITYNTVEALQAAGTTSPSIGRGGGAAIHGKATVTNNTIAFNGVLRPVSADNALGSGGGAYFDGEGTFANNIVSFNTVEEGSSADHGGLALGPAAASGVTVSHNLFHANAPDDSGEYAGADGNVAGDPLFVGGTPYHFQLQPGSSAMDVGDDAWVAAGDTDLDGRPRVLGPRVDIGAYEAEPAVPEAPARVYVRADGSDATDGESWAAAKATVAAAVDTVATDGEVWVAAGTYAEKVSLRGAIRLLGGFKGTETAPDQRDVRANRTILDGGGSGTVVVIPSEADGAAVDGFTIRNGGYDGYMGGLIAEKAGGGIASLGDDTIIANNVIEANHIRLSGESPTASGAGVMVAGGSATIRGNIVRDNSIETTRQDVFPQFPNRTEALGGGIYVSDARVDISNNLVLGNSVAATDAKGGLLRPFGAGIYARYATGLIANNTLSRNLAAPPSDPTAPPDGGAVYLDSATDQLTLANNIVAFNSSGVMQKRSSALFYANDVYGNGTDYGVVDADVPSTANGNISKDPLFADRANGDFHLTAGSPAIDSGSGTYVRFDTDLDGKPRVAGAAVDMGAYEYAPAATPFGNAATALRIAGGLEAAPADITALNAETGGGSAGVVDIADAVRLLRDALGAGGQAIAR